MSTYSELRTVITKMESDIKSIKDRPSRYLDEYEKGFADGALETMESTLKFLEAISHQLSWEETPDPVPEDMDPEFGDIPPIRQGMGG